MKSQWIKRCFDLTILVLTAPFWLLLLMIIAPLVMIKLGSPVLFRQRRPGRDGLIFELIKFRTMSEERDKYGNLRSDADRMTTFGCWLRSTSLDELPEFWNILKGEMSLVGPRPLLVQYLEHYTPEQKRRHEVQPGLTGWAQIKGRNILSWEKKFELDVWYVENRTFWLDIKIIWMTLRQVLLREGVAAVGEATMPEFKPKD